MDLVTLGEALVCLIGRETGPLETVRTFDRSVGGAEANTAVGLARLGLRTSWLSRVGDDGFGRVIVQQLREEGVDVTGVSFCDQPTGLMVKERRSPGDVDVHYYRQGSAASHLDAHDVQPERISTARRLHATGVTLALGPAPRRAVQRAVEIAAATDVPVSFDPNLRPKLWSVAAAVDACHAVFPYVTDLLCNEQEAKWLAGTDTLEDAVEYLKAQGFLAVVVKRGALGAVGYRDGRAVELQPHPVEALDSVGAGDAFNAGYLFGELTGLSFESSLEVGNWAAANVVAHHGDYEGFPGADAYQEWALSGRRGEPTSRSGAASTRRAESSR